MDPIANNITEYKNKNCKSVDNLKTIACNISPIQIKNVATFMTHNLIDAITKIPYDSPLKQISKDNILNGKTIQKGGFGYCFSLDSVDYIIKIIVCNGQNIDIINKEIDLSVQLTLYDAKRIQVDEKAKDAKAKPIFLQLLGYFDTISYNKFNYYNHLKFEYAQLTIYDDITQNQLTKIDKSNIMCENFLIMEKGIDLIEYSEIFEKSKQNNETFIKNIEIILNGFKNLLYIYKIKLNDKYFIHNDIKLDNILLMPNQTLKIIDFGLSIETPSFIITNNSGTYDFAIFCRFEINKLTNKNEAVKSPIYDIFCIVTSLIMFLTLIELKRDYSKSSPINLNDLFMREIRMLISNISNITKSINHNIIKDIIYFYTIMINITYIMIATTTPNIHKFTPIYTEFNKFLYDSKIDKEVENYQIEISNKKDTEYLEEETILNNGFDTLPEIITIQAEIKKIFEEKKIEEMKLQESLINENKEKNIIKQNVLNEKITIQDNLISNLLQKYRTDISNVKQNLKKTQTSLDELIESIRKEIYTLNIDELYKIKLVDFKTTTYKQHKVDKIKELIINKINKVYEQKQHNLQELYLNEQSSIDTLYFKTLAEYNKIKSELYNELQLIKYELENYSKNITNIIDRHNENIKRKEEIKNEIKLKKKSIIKEKLNEKYNKLLIEYKIQLKNKYYTIYYTDDEISKYNSYTNMKDLFYYFMDISMSKIKDNPDESII